MHNIVFFPGDNHIEYCLLLAKRLAQYGSNITFMVYTDMAEMKCRENGIQYVCINSYFDDYFKIRDRINQWWKKNETIAPCQLMYAGYNVWDLCAYERAVDNDKDAEGNLEAHLKRTAEAIEVFYHIIDYLEPHIFIAWNGMCLPMTAFTQVAKNAGIEVYYAERGFFPRTLVLDKNGINFGSTPSQQWHTISPTLSFERADEEKTRHYFSDLHLHAESIAGSTQKITPDQVRSQFNIPPGAKIVLYVAQIDTDTNIVFYSPAYKSNKELIVKLNKFISEQKDAFLLVKLHPEDVNRSAEFQDLLTGNAALVGDINIQSLLQMVDVVVVRNSTVGLEALTYHKPVVVLGQAIYSHKGLTCDAVNDQELKGTIAAHISHHAASESTHRATDRFLFYLLKYYLYFIDEEEVFRGSNSRIEKSIVDSVNPSQKKGRYLNYNRRYSFYEMMQQRLMKKFFSSNCALKKADRTTENKEILFIIYNTTMPYAVLLEQLAVQCDPHGTVTILGNEYLKTENLKYNKFYIFNFYNLVQCFFKPYDLLIFSSAPFLKLTVLIYLWLSRAKKKMLLTPFNISQFFFKQA